jgi:hypothetical protein
MSILSSDPITQLAFSMFENKGVYALLLGSGLSRAAGIPTGWEITLDLVRRVALAQGVENQSDWAMWYCDRNGTNPDYSALLAELAISAAERRSILHSYIEPDDEDRAEGKKLPTAAHHTIAGLVRDGYVRVIVTTNFDRLLENALREIGVEPTVVSSVDTLSGAEPITHSACYVLIMVIIKMPESLTPMKNWVRIRLYTTDSLIAFSTNMALSFAAGRASGMTRCAQHCCVSLAGVILLSGAFEASPVAARKPSSVSVRQ